MKESSLVTDFVIEPVRNWFCTSSDLTLKSFVLIRLIYA